jgi:hypothetical protein
MVSVSSRNVCAALMWGCLHPSIAFRPAAVIRSRTTSIVFPPASITSRSLAASRRRTRLASTPLLNPRLRASICSLTPWRLLASSFRGSLLLRAYADYRHRREFLQVLAACTFIDIACSVNSWPGRRVAKAMGTSLHIATIEALRERIRCLEGGARHGRAILPFGVKAIDERLPEGGLALGALHEVAGGNGAIDGAAAALFAAASQRGLGGACCGA